MAALEVLALNTVIPQIQAPQVGDTYLFPRAAEFSAGTQLLPSLAGPSDPDTGMWFPAANTVAWSAGGLEAMRINPNRRVGIGGSGNDFHRLTVVENSNNGGSILCQTTSDTVAPGVTQLRARTSGAVQNGDGLGAVAFQGYDGVSGNGTTLITGAVDGVTGTGNVPTRLLFWTTPSGSVTPLERMRITSAGAVGIGTTSPAATLDVNGNIHATQRLQLTSGFANVSLLESSTGVGYRWSLANNGTYRLQRTANGTYSDATTPIIFDASNNVGIGTTNPSQKLDVVGQIRTTLGVTVDGGTTNNGAVAMSTSNNQSLGGPVIYFLGSSNGTAFATSGTQQGSVNFYGPQYSGGCAITAFATENQNVTSLGGELRIYTTPNGTTAQQERMRIKSAGQVRFVPLAAAPTVDVQDGDVYYDGGTNKLRVRAGGAWTDLH
jgi:hypothetical protein